MPSKSRDVRHLELHEQLTSWAKQNQFSTNPYIVGLLAALETRRNLTFWASLNVVDLLPRPSYRSAQRKISSSLALIRNVLIFVPVALTWTAVGKATTAFQAYNKQNPNNLSNFLDFWQNGYGVLSDSWKIGHIALLDAIIILILISLIVIIHFLNQRIVADERATTRKAEEKRLSLALDIGQYLHSKRQITDLTMKDALADATNNLVETSKHLNKSAAELVKLSKSTSLSRLAALIKGKERDPFTLFSSDESRFKF